MAAMHAGPKYVISRTVPQNTDPIPHLQNRGQPE
jgi:hypothetical protein